MQNEKERYIRVVFYDTETTGLKPEEGDRVIEFGAVEWIYDTETGKFSEKLDAQGNPSKMHLYFNPDRDSGPPAVVKVHGIETAFLQDKKRFYEHIQEIHDFIKGPDDMKTFIVAHNAPFDIKFMNNEIRLANERLGTSYNRIETTAYGSIDSKDVFAANYKSRQKSLDALCDYFNVDRSARAQFHGAWVDAKILGQGFACMLKELGAEKILVASDAIFKEMDKKFEVKEVPANEAVSASVAQHMVRFGQAKTQEFKPQSIEQKARPSARM